MSFLICRQYACAISVFSSSKLPEKWFWWSEQSLLLKTCSFSVRYFESPIKMRFSLTPLVVRTLVYEFYKLLVGACDGSYNPYIYICDTLYMTNIIYIYIDRYI